MHSARHGWHGRGIVPASVLERAMHRAGSVHLQSRVHARRPRCHAVQMRGGMRGWMSERRMYRAELLHMQSRIPEGTRRQRPAEMHSAGMN